MNKLLMQTKVNAINVADRARRSPFETIQVEIAQNIVITQCGDEYLTETRTLRWFIFILISQTCSGCYFLE